MFGLIDVEEATLGEPNAVDKVGGGTSKSLPHLDGLFWSLDGGEGGGVRTSVLSFCHCRGW